MLSKSMILNLGYDINAHEAHYIEDPNTPINLLC